ncbi:41985_t:CDS:2 [Gigaspora margarita]|uniref:41985_t:CDS:1 n=1 Tax=Gigaspora margarita TaxID=4874 RepID=A0ABM8VZN7_GIGMA|nr:41985_t:CDS:2 [Gigaspora margarita]
MFLSGLHRKTPTFVAVSEPKNLEEAIVSACRKNEKGQDKRQEFRKDITCYNCGEASHIAQNCMSEKVPKKGSEDKDNVSNYVENIPCEVGEGWEEDEVYTVGENRYQPYAGNSKKVAQGRPDKAPGPGRDDKTEKGKDDPSLITKEKKWLLFLAELEYEDYRDKTLKENLTANANKEVDTPNLDTLYSVETPKWGKSTVGIEFSNDVSNLDNNLPCRAKMWLGSDEAWWDLDDDKNDYDQGWEKDQYPTETNQDEYANLEPTEAGMPEEEKEW